MATRPPGRPGVSPTGVPGSSRSPLPGRPGVSPTGAPASIPTDSNERTDAGSGKSIRAMQEFLKKQGYKILVTGQLDALTKSALKDWHSGVNNRSPLAWNKQHSLVQDGKIAPGVKTDSHDRGAGSGGSGAGGGFGAGVTDGAVDFASLFAGLNPNIGTPFDLTLADGGASLLDPAVADKIAGGQFDSMIRDLRAEIGRQPGQAAQNLNDIGSWYGQVLKSLGTAAQRDTAITNAGVGSIQNAVAKIVSSLGGEANLGSPMVGAAGAESVGTLQALGAAQDQYNADIAPLLEAEKAGSLSRENARQSIVAADLARQLRNAQSERGAAKAGAALDLERYNNDIRDRQLERRMQIQQANNALAQQGFGNKLALGNAGIAAAMSGVEMTTALADLATGEPQEPKGWDALSPTDRQKLTAGLVDSVKVGGKWRMPMNASWARIIGLIRTQGLDPFSPAGKQYLAGLARALGIRLGPGGNPVGR